MRNCGVGFADKIKYLLPGRRWTARAQRGKAGRKRNAGDNVTMIKMHRRAANLSIGLLPFLIRHLTARIPATRQEPPSAVVPQGHFHAALGRSLHSAAALVSRPAVSSLCSGRAPSHKGEGKADSPVGFAGMKHSTARAAT